MMVKNRHTDLHEADLTAPVTAPAGFLAGVEVLSLAELRARVLAGRDPDALAAPARPDFHQLLTLTGGRLRQSVDFTAYDLERGAWLWARPGQVLQWGDLDAAEGTLVRFRPGFPGPAAAAAAGLDDPHAPPLRMPSGADRAALRTAVGHLESEFRARGRLSPDAYATVVRHLLDVLLLRVAHLPAAGGTVAEPGETFRRFRSAVDRDFARTRRLEDYARALGYSSRTLSRATLAATGIGAKEFIDRRVILESRRLLAHGDQPAARIASRLGFSSATNFSKYFQQRTGTAPIAFREAVREAVRERPHADT
ncbi:helix-turn-helix transcriptional regulator [Streptomyces sp. NPDC050704]|uniref:helix-turn-helix transcriptional regulator n=1 Tax=Streptomyces sp. NPDC050704 TaxID=3157219 RepID=UPI003422B5F2